MYAVIEAGGGQLKVSKDDLVVLDRLGADVGSNIELDKVLLISGEELKIGKPYVEGAKVIAEVISHDKGDKVETFKYRPRHRYRKTVGFRARQTTIRIQDIQA